MFFHDTREKRTRLESRQPALNSRPRLRAEPRCIGVRKLPYERKDGHVGQAGPALKKPVAVGRCRQHRFQIRQPQCAGVSVLQRKAFVRGTRRSAVSFGKAIRVLVAVKVVFEEAIVGSDQTELGVSGR